MGGVALQPAAAALGHGPSVATSTVERHVDAHMVFGVDPGTQAFKRTGVIGGKHTPHESDDGQGMLAVIADRIEIPPEITTRRNGLVESR